MNTRFTGCDGSREQGVWWFRICGYGLLLKAPWNIALYSERANPKQFFLHWKKWRVRTLKP